MGCGVVEWLVVWQCKQEKIFFYNKKVRIQKQAQSQQLFFQSAIENTLWSSNDLAFSCRKNEKRSLTFPPYLPQKINPKLNSMSRHHHHHRHHQKVKFGQTKKKWNEITFDLIDQNEFQLFRLSVVVVFKASINQIENTNLNGTYVKKEHFICSYVAGMTSVAGLVGFWRLYLVTNFLPNVAQKFGDFWASLKTKLF